MRGGRSTNWRGKGSGDRLDRAGKERDALDRHQALPQGHRALLEAGRPGTNPTAAALRQGGAKVSSGPVGPRPGTSRSGSTLPTLFEERLKYPPQERRYADKMDRCSLHPPLESRLEMS